ncbi:dipeptide/oligopeptide/nickel ABC transporter permease/ATP-binding protein [Gulosibacter chungangensis]|uniref:Dipeptide/oligopeptide/nickel ABC transporter permease/ATP-binding protein n=1 Tax=Gulosibacter chungangensis TaxID=979746 RepID=A0A7J5B8U4_9MICO|nr:dipeptide/oligopeptide/nickel ABC transporter permease/ATP-binding protein [Gulosibacter chungangensis]KAB1641218.1 dipeptide/oligopeptide/nickel ABC transporter permease/ATP-binding protein [Gulosibacter chungangensis]
MSQTTTTAIRTGANPEARQASNVGRVVARLFKQPTTVISLIYIVLLVLVAVASPWITPYDPNQTNYAEVFSPPSAEHLLGTDDMGKDVLSRLMFGAQAVLLVALGSVAIALVIGVPLGLLFGFLGGWWDRIGMRFVDMLQSLPGMLIGLTVVTILGRNVFILMFAIGLIFSMAFARLTRAIVLVERTKPYVEAAEVAGLSTGQQIFGQVLPNLIGPLVTQAMVYFGSAIMIESAMSFLGIGLPTESASWGQMLSLAVDNQNNASYLSWPPGIAIVLTVLAFNIFGDGFNDALTGERRRKPKRVAQPKVDLKRVATETAAIPEPTVDADLALDAREVVVGLATSGREQTNIVKRATLNVAKGEIVGLLGESGSGKSTFARAVLGMLPAGTWLDHGSIKLDGVEIAGANPAQLRKVRGTKIGAVFQDPMTALSPVHTIGTQLIEPLRIHKGMNRKQARARAIELLDRVGVRNADSRLDDYPHQFSGGMAQRVAIAMALAAEPDLLIADEATSALDVTTQSQVLDLIMDLRDEYGMGVLMITHSLGVVAEACDRAAVMYRGTLVETADVQTLFEQPAHPYTEALLAANPLNADTAGRLPVIDAERRAEIDALIEQTELERSAT